ncbi:aromatic amino acid transport family protein [Patescibacteria group bacterium]
MPNKKFLLALATVIATIIGGGIFALPYAFSQAGFWPSLGIFIGLVVINIMVMLMFGEVVLRTHGTKHQATGYAGIYLGRPGKALMMIIQMIGGFGGLLIFTIGVGDFLFDLFGGRLPESQMMWGLAFFGVASIFVILGIRLIARTDFIIFLMFLVIIFIMVVAAIPEISPINFAKIDLGKILFPFGVIIFSLSGASAIPLLDDMFPGKRKQMKDVIIWGVVISAIVSLIYTLVVLGLGGESVSQDSLATIRIHLPGSVSFLMGIFGIIAMGTSFLTSGVVLREMFEYDTKMPRLWALVLVLSVPLLLYLLNVGTFVGTISFVGSVTGGLGAILIIWMLQRAKKIGTREPEYQVNYPKIALGIIGGVYALAIGYEIFTLIFK